MKKTHVNLNKVTENIAAEMLGIAQLKHFKEESLNNARILKKAGYSRAETIEYLYGFTFEHGLMPYFALVVRWAKQIWRER